MNGLRLSIQVKTTENPMHYYPEVRLTLNRTPVVTLLFPSPPHHFHSFPGFPAIAGQSIPAQGSIR